MCNFKCILRSLESFIFFFGGGGLYSQNSFKKVVSVVFLQNEEIIKIVNFSVMKNDAILQNINKIKGFNVQMLIGHASPNFESQLK